MSGLDTPSHGLTDALPDAGAAPRLSVCVCTFRRPALLQELLASLAAQTLPLHSFEVVVVDNDPAASARAAVEAFAKAHAALRLQYAVECATGVSHARNRAVREASAARLAFIDDDEVAAPDWLEQLDAAMDRYGADIVLGPTRVRLDDPMPDWVRSLNARSHLDEFASGEPATYGAGGAGNALMRRTALRERGDSPFDPALTRTGGEDAELFEWVRACGGAVVWCAEAQATERLSPERLHAGFYVERALCFATVHWRGVYRRASPAAVLGHVAVGASAAIVLAPAALLAWPFARARSVRLLMLAARGAGRLLALTRYDVRAYGIQPTPGAA